MHQLTACIFQSGVSFQFGDVSLQLGYSGGQMRKSHICTLEYIYLFTNAHKQLEVQQKPWKRWYGDIVNLNPGSFACLVTWQFIQKYLIIIMIKFIRQMTAV